MFHRPVREGGEEVVVVIVEDDDPGFTTDEGVKMAAGAKTECGVASLAARLVLVAALVVTVV